MTLLTWEWATNKICSSIKLRLLNFQREEEETSNARIEIMVEGVVMESNYSECSSAADRSVSCCRSLAIVVSIMLLAF